MTNSNASAVAQDWTYFKLYLGSAVDRIDSLIVTLKEVVASVGSDLDWFFLRYFDEKGVHIRLRAHLRGDTGRFVQLKSSCASALRDLHAQPPGTYHPMVVAPGFEDFTEKLAVAYNDLKIMEDDYEPEFDKYGGPAGVAIAHDLFRVSSEIACEVLSAERAGEFSRKDVVPSFMDASFRAFVESTSDHEFWRQYAFYWLGGASPAAEDWRQRFFAKGRALLDQGIPVLPEHWPSSSASRQVERWKQAVTEAASRYRALGREAQTTDEVLAFNFAHLMNNRLGLAALEEAYMATLLEVRSEEGARS